MSRGEFQLRMGLTQKNRHNEKTLEFLRSETVSRAYPFPYGFIMGTTAADGLNLDCFVITEQSLKSGDIVECKPVGLMEQIEDGEEDHNVLAVVQGENLDLDCGVQATLTDFVCHFLITLQESRFVWASFWESRRPRPKFYNART